jgi:hypothetical protein
MFNPAYAWTGKNSCNIELTPIVDVAAEPKKFLGKTLAMEGTFYSFSTLPLDYPAAMRSSKDFIGIVLSRPDYLEIPLVELKLAVPIKKFKDDSLSGLEHGDVIQVRGKVYAVALGEPWIELDSIVVVKKSPSEDRDFGLDSPGDEED